MTNVNANCHTGVGSELDVGPVFLTRFNPTYNYPNLTRPNIKKKLWTRPHPTHFARLLFLPSAAESFFVRQITFTSDANVIVSRVDHRITTFVFAQTIRLNVGKISKQ